MQSILDRLGWTIHSVLSSIRHTLARLFDRPQQEKPSPKLAQSLEAQLEGTPSDALETREALLRRLIEVYGAAPHQPRRVVSTLTRLETLLETAGEHERLLEVIEAQQKQFQSMKRWPDLIERMRHRAEITQDMEQRKQLYLQVAAFYLDKFGNQAEAIKSFEAVLACDPHDPTAIKELTVLYRRRRDWDRLRALPSITEP